jgi:hypothetical protein
MASLIAYWTPERVVEPCTIASVSQLIWYNYSLGESEPNEPVREYTLLSHLRMASVAAKQLHKGERGDAMARNN